MAHARGTALVNGSRCLGMNQWVRHSSMVSLERDCSITEAAKTQRLMRISVLGAGRRGSLETADLKETFLSHLGCQCLWVPSGRYTMEGLNLAL